MKTAIMLIVYCLVLQSLHAQKYDNTWLWGWSPSQQNDTNFPLRGNAEGKFINNTFSSRAVFRNMTFVHCNSNISDADGNLLFYTNGLRVMDTSATIIYNGDSLNYGDAWNLYQGGGMRFYSALYILPMPLNDSTYVIVHIRNDSLSESPFYFSNDLCYTIVKKYGNGYKVLEKNVIVVSGLLGIGNLAVCKHANGRDWWIVFSELNTNCHYKYLYNGNSITFQSVQCLGRPLVMGDVGNSVFSQDGTKYVRHLVLRGIDVFDFDRCNGVLSNLIEIETYPEQGWINSVQISDNNRFVYGCPNGVYVLQWDLAAADVNAHIDTVGVIDGFIDTIPGAGSAPFLNYISQYGPDGKIYWGCGSSSQRFFSVLEYPNGQGTLSNYCHRCVVLPKQSTLTISQFPNYRLGRLPGSACDTVYNSIKPLYAQAPKLNVYPNPAMDEVKLDYNWVEWETVRNVELRITNVMGQVVQVIAVPRYSTVQQVSVGKLAAGVYTVQLNALQQGKAVQLATVKMSKM